jgi:hypothetical protein
MNLYTEFVYLVPLLAVICLIILGIVLGNIKWK